MNAPTQSAAPATAGPRTTVPVPDTRRLVADALRDIQPDPEVPTWSHRLFPATLRDLFADLGFWNNPQRQKPSTHLQQTLAVLRRYGWCQTLDASLTGRLCIRGAQNLLEKTGHVTPAARQRAVAYMQHALAQADVAMAFHAWNDLPGQSFTDIETLLHSAARAARKNGE